MKRKKRPKLPAEDRTFYYVQLPRPDGSWMTLHKTNNKALANVMAKANHSIDGRFLSKTHLIRKEGEEAVDNAEAELETLSTAKQLIVERLVAAYQEKAIKQARRKTKDVLLRDVPIALHERIAMAYKDAHMKSMRDWILKLCKDNTQQYKQKKEKIKPEEKGETDGATELS